jgi:hypothetical protein
VRGLHRAADMNHYLDALNVSLDEFEAFITDSLYQEKMLARYATTGAMEDYFKLNSPRFDAIEVSHIVLDSEGKAQGNDLVPARRSRQFRRHGARAFDGRHARAGGVIGKVLRGSLRADIEAKVFNAAPGDLLGPFPSADRSFFEIFLVRAKHPARLDADVAAEVKRLLREHWLARGRRNMSSKCARRGAADAAPGDAIRGFRKALVLHPPSQSARRLSRVSVEILCRFARDELRPWLPRREMRTLASATRCAAPAIRPTGLNA